MKGNDELMTAKLARQDEFYTAYADVEKEMESYGEGAFRGKVVLCPCDTKRSHVFGYFSKNFDRLGLEALLRTNAADGGVRGDSVDLLGGDRRGSWEEISRDGGKLQDGGGRLRGDGDFRSAEIRNILQEANAVVTNPPFSLLREFVDWADPSKRKVAILGNLNSATSKSVFPHILAGNLWFGPSISGGSREFEVPEDYPLTATESRTDAEGRKYVKVKCVRWLTNFEFPERKTRRLELRTMEENVRDEKSAAVRSMMYKEYDNYRAIEVPRTLAIPSDWDGPMGVPITFLDKWNPRQFEILGCSYVGQTPPELRKPGFSRYHNPTIGGAGIYQRIFIRRIG